EVAGSQQGGGQGAAAFQVLHGPGVLALSQQLPPPVQGAFRVAALAPDVIEACQSHGEQGEQGAQQGQGMRVAPPPFAPAFQQTAVGSAAQRQSGQVAAQV